MTSVNSKCQTLGVSMGRWLALTVAMALAPMAAQAQFVPVSQQLSPAGEAPTLLSEPAVEAEPSGLVTVESDLQQADNVTGVVTATGNVKISYPPKQVQAWARQAQYFTKEERIVLVGDVEVIQEGGNRLEAERVTYLVLEDRLIADPAAADQVLSKFKLERTAPLEAAP
jgi:lipopolysaccharide export system protein LptA